MNEKNVQQILHEIAEEEIPSQSVDLVSKVKANYQQKTSGQKKNRLNWAVGLATVLLVGFVFLVFTPQGRVIAEDILEFFIRADSDSIDRETAEETFGSDESADPDPTSILNADKTVKEVESGLQFDVYEPTWLPEYKFHFEGANLDAEQDIAYQFWGMVGFDTNALVLSQEPAIEGECQLCSPVGISAIVEEVSINGIKGEYVIGVWKWTEEGLVWENEPWLQRLRWQSYGMAFEVLFMGPPEEITQEELVQIAESLK